MLGDHAERALPEDQPQRVAAVEAHLGVLTLVHRLIGSSRAHPLAYALGDEGGMDHRGDRARAAGGDEEQRVGEKDHRRGSSRHCHVGAAREREKGSAGGEEEGEEIGQALAAGPSGEGEGEQRHAVINEEGPHLVGLDHQAGHARPIDAAAVSTVDPLFPGVGRDQEGDPGQDLQHRPDVLAVPHESPSEEEEEDGGKPGTIGLRQLSEAGAGGVGRHEAERRHGHEGQHQHLGEPEAQPGPSLGATRQPRHRTEDDEQVGHVRAGDSGQRQRIDLAEGQIGDHQQQVPARAGHRREDRHDREGGSEEEHRLAVFGDVDQPGHREGPGIEEGQDETGAQLCPRAQRGRADPRRRGRGSPGHRRPAREVLGPGGHLSGPRGPGRSP